MTVTSNKNIYTAENVFPIGHKDCCYNIPVPTLTYTILLVTELGFV